MSGDHYRKKRITKKTIKATTYMCLLLFVELTNFKDDWETTVNLCIN